MDRVKKRTLIAYLITIVSYLIFPLIFSYIWGLEIVSIVISSFLVCLTGIVGGLIAPNSYKTVWKHFILTIFVYLPIVAFIVIIFSPDFGWFLVLLILLAFLVMAVNVCICLGYFLCLRVGSKIGMERMERIEQIERIERIEKNHTDSAPFDGSSEFNTVSVICPSCGAKKLPNNPHLCPNCGYQFNYN